MRSEVAKTRNWLTGLCAVSRSGAGLRLCLSDLAAGLCLWPSGCVATSAHNSGLAASCGRGEAWGHYIQTIQLNEQQNLLEMDYRS